MATTPLFPASHKTVFVLDHGRYFALPCQQVEFDVGRRGGTGLVPLAPVSKTVWTVAVEAVAEYCRIVWDIFPRGERLGRVLAAGERPDSTETAGNSWEEAGQCMSAMMEVMGKAGRPSPDQREPGLVAGIRSGLELLAEASPRQLQVGETVVNRGRLVVVTTLESDSEYQRLVRATEQQLTAVNKEEKDGRLRLGECELVILHTEREVVRLRGEQDVGTQPCPALQAFLHTAVAGPALASKLLYLCLKHYGLASTTVTGIPMKEEQNASSSANYDVELFHVAASQESELAELPLSRREDCEYSTVTLKWCTPRGAAGVELHHTSAAHRITPTEVNSRQSSCLTNFLLSGRSVMLEMQRRSSGSKTLSHMLTSHGGEIFIHTLASQHRSSLEDPPSISEGPGGRVTDYRIPDLALLMKTHRLAPWPQRDQVAGDTPGVRARQLLDRATRVFPATISSTTIFNMPVCLPLLTLLQQEMLTEEGVAECQKVIYSLVSMENKGESLPSPLVVTPNPSNKKGSRKEEQYRLMFSELERFVTAHSGNSGRHHAVLECLMQVGLNSHVAQLGHVYVCRCEISRCLSSGRRRARRGSRRGSWSATRP